MIKRVTIHGDSFAEPQWENIHPTWYGRLKDRWPETVNYGKSGSGPMYSFKKFYENLFNYNYEDLIIFIMSGGSRINFNIKEAEDEMHQWNNKVMLDITDNPYIGDDLPSKSKYDDWMEINKDRARFAVDIFHDEIVYGNWKYESLLYAASRIQKCKIFVWYLEMEESYIQTSLNDDHFYVHDEGLADAVENEYVEEERLHEDFSLSHDLHYKVNHLTEANHEVMYKQVTGFIDGREIPKFLKNVYRGTYNKDEFIYD